MGYVLFWLEAAITTVLFVALADAWIARRKGKWSRVALWIATTLLTLLFWGVAITGFSLVYAFGKLGLVQLWMSSICFGLVILACVIVARRGRRKIPSADPAAQDLPACRSWRLGRLSLAFVAALMVTAMTYWNLSLSVQQELAEAHAEAVAAMQSVWPAPVPPSMNAAPLYRQAYELLDAQDTEKSKWSNQVSDALSQFIRYDSAPPSTQPVEPVLKSAAPALALVRQAAALPGYNANVDFQGIATLLPPLSKYRSLCKLVLLDSLQAARGGRGDQAMDDLSVALGMSAHMAQSPFIIGNLVSIAMNALSVRAFEQVLATVPPTAGSLSHLKIDATSAAYEGFKSSVKLEYASTVSSLSQPWTLLNQLRDTSWNGPTIATATAAKLSPYIVFVWPEEVKAAQQYYQTLISELDLPYSEWKPKAEALDNNLHDKPGLLAKMLLPTLSRARTQVARGEAQHRQAYLAKAMWLYRLKNGHFPEKLELLAPEFVPVVPKDPFTDKDMLIGHTVEGKTFLYSVGSDLKDDGGKEYDSREIGDIPFYLEGGRPTPAKRPLPASQPATTPGGG